MEVYIVDDEDRVYRVVQKRFPHLNVFHFKDGIEVLNALSRKLPDLLLVDLFFEKTPPPRLLNKNLPQKEGLAIIVEALKYLPPEKIYLISRYVDRGTIDWLSSKGVKFIDTGWTEESLYKKMEGILGKRDYSKIEEKLAAYGFYTKNEKILSQVSELDLSYGSKESILFVGETGTGKNALARAINSIVNGPSSPFVEVMMPNMDGHLFESQLFGYEKGAFTGALAAKKGKLDMAAGGSLLFDELGLIGEALQARLLQVMEAKHFTRLGGTKAFPVKVKFMGATMIEEMLQALKFRFNKIIYLPPLRERPEDVQAIISAYEEKGLRLTPSCRKFLLEEAHYPGNVRMLVNILKGLIKEKDGSLERAYNLWAAMIKGEEKGSKGHFAQPKTQEISLEKIIDWMDRQGKNLEELRREIFRLMLSRGDSPEKIQNLLGISRQTFYRMKKSLS